MRPSDEALKKFYEVLAQEAIRIIKEEKGGNSNGKHH
jgi:hypothetical protein